MCRRQAGGRLLPSWAPQCGISRQRWSSNPARPGRRRARVRVADSSAVLALAAVQAIYAAPGTNTRHDTRAESRCAPWYPPRPYTSHAFASSSTATTTTSTPSHVGYIADGSPSLGNGLLRHFRVDDQLNVPIDTNTNAYTQPSPPDWHKETSSGGSRLASAWHV